MSSNAPAENPTPGEPPTLAGEIPTSGFEEFLESHGKKAAAIILLIIVGAAGWFFFRAKSEGDRREAGEAFSAAVTRSDFKAVAEKYSGTVAGGNALLLLADRQLDADQIKDAHATLSNFVAKHESHPLYHNGVFALACVNEKLGELDAALSGFQKVASAGAEVTASAAAAIRAADIQMSKGELDIASDAFQGFAAKFPSSPFIPTSEKRIALVEQKIALRDHPAPPPEPEPEPESPADPSTTPGDPANAPTTPGSTAVDPATPPTDPDTSTDPGTPDPTTPTDPANTPTDPATSPTTPDTDATDPATAPDEGETGASTDAPDSSSATEEAETTPDASTETP